jgi:diaminopimelate epimerase
MHGLGNDFIIINGFQEQLLERIELLANRICDRHFGVGGDGLVLILPSNGCDLRMRMFNPDGSEAEMCGNAIRCVAQYVFEKKIVEKKIITVETLAGTITPELVNVGKQVQAVRVDMGEPKLNGPEIPVQGIMGPIIGKTLIVEEKSYLITCVSMGNPHCILFVNDLDPNMPGEVGPKIEKHLFFPQRTNVEFIQIVNEQEIIMRVWERGAGETLACGTGACAAVVAGVLNGKIQREVKVRLAGGELMVNWNPVNNHVYLTGPAATVFEGDLLFSAYLI